ncbi:MAG TPA: peptidase M16 [Rhodobacteraceae bacterium]|jgi:zinc protease|nr:peptidase M16 [Paracoccaceae bacterium]
MIRVLWAAVAAVLLAAPLRAEIAIQELMSPGGVQVWLVEEHSIPFTALEIRFQGGGSLDLAGKRGATNLMVGLLEEGAGALDARGFTTAKEELAAEFSYDIGDDAVSISARFLTENRAASVELLRQSLVEPRFDADAIERVRAQVLTGLRQDEKDPRALASRAFDTMAFGDHPYATSFQGTLDSVAGLTREDLVVAHQGALARDRLYVSAVGDITAAEVTALVDTLFAALPATGAPLPEAITPNFPGGVKVTDFDTPQSVVLFGQPGLDRDDPDFFAAFVLDHILGGGGFESRLMQEVREKRGLTYGVYSYLADRDSAFWWGGSLNSQNERAAEAIDVIRAEWLKMRDAGVSDAELSDAKTYLTGAYPLRFDGNGPIAAILVGMQMQGLPTSYVTERNAKVDAVTKEDVARVAKRLMDPEALTFVVVGRPAGI